MACGFTFIKNGSNFIVDDAYYYDNFRAVVEVDELTNVITSLAPNDNDVLIGQYNGHSYFYLNSTDTIFLNIYIILETAPRNLTWLNLIQWRSGIGLKPKH